MKKHIVMIACSRYSTDNRIRREAETLASLDEFDVSILVTKEGELPKKYLLDGVNVAELNMRRFSSKSKTYNILKYIAFLMKSFVACNKLLVNRKIDVIHVHNMPNFLVFAAIIPRLIGKKLMLDIHDTFPETYAAKFADGSNIVFKLLCWEERIACYIANKVICVNHPQKDALINRGIPPNKISVSMNVPDHRVFNLHLDNKNAAEANNKFRLVYHGTLAKRLGVDLALQAVSELAKKIPGLEFQIYGGGEDFEELIQLSKILGVEETVVFHKPVQIKALPPILREMHLGVIANKKSIATELMLPVKMLEYIALGIPVVAPRLKTIQYYFEEDMVSYFEPEDVDSLINTILELYQDGAKRRAQAERAMEFLNKYGWEKQQMDFINLYKS